MRRLIVFAFCSLSLAHVLANDAPEAKHASAPASAPKPASASTPASAKPLVRDMPASSAAARAEATAAKEAAMQKDLGNKIAARLAALRRERAANPVPFRPAPSLHRSSSTYVGSAVKMKEEEHVAHWSYEGEGGPIRWARLNPAWTACENGSRQSPIDIREGIKVDLEPVSFDYKPARFNVIDNGHTIQVNLGAGNYITVMGRMYELVQFHFHRPSEERVNGKAFQMVAHLVHKNADGKLAVVAVLIEDGNPNSLVQIVWNNLPLEKNDPVTPSVVMDMNQILPERREYYTYMGSLTTPPCSEGVLWIVMKEPIHLSTQQIGIFSRLYPMNARPIQTMSGRLIKESN